MVIINSYELRITVTLSSRVLFDKIRENTQLPFLGDTKVLYLKLFYDRIYFLS